MNDEFLRSIFGLQDRVALITGAGRGLGRSMAMALAQAGSNLALVSRTEAELKEVADQVKTFSPEKKVFLAVADLSDFSKINEVVDTVVSYYGRIDILVNNAGRNIRGDADKFSVHDWDAVIDINLKSVFLMIQAAGRVMIRQKRGKIINIESLASFIGLPNMVAYCASRGGVKQMTKALAVEWAKYGIQVNAIAPGYFLTEQTKPVFDDPKKKEWILSRIPMGRTGNSEQDLAGVVVFLASSASDYITGQAIIVDGGWLAS